MTAPQMKKKAAEPRRDPTIFLLCIVFLEVAGCGVTGVPFVKSGREMLNKRESENSVRL
jgi:hypothetical protein